MAKHTHTGVPVALQLQASKAKSPSPSAMPQLIATRTVAIPRGTRRLIEKRDWAVTCKESVQRAVKHSFGALVGMELMDVADETMACKRVTCDVAQPMQCVSDLKCLAFAHVLIKHSGMR